MNLVSAFASGVLFAVGLALSGMTGPANVVGFLDFFGDWKPALGLVMAGAVGVYAALYPLVLRRAAPIYARRFDLPRATKADARLYVGAAVFGAGWGLSGFCPGPALVTLGAGAGEAAVFTIAMIVGVVLHRFAKGDARDVACG